MIFVTVGTHEQGMDRMFIELDRLIENGELEEEIFAQIGYSNYIPKNYKYKKMIRYDEMDQYVREGNIVITHGGPGSIFHPLQYGKIPIVVPRNPEFNEHIDNHQILFTRRLEANNKVVGIYNIKELILAINNYAEISKKCSIDSSSNVDFIRKFDKVVNEML